jgi:16S rRNA G966 N2-methylase RsmD
MSEQIIINDTIINNSNNNNNNIISNNIINIFDTLELNDEKKIIQHNNYIENSSSLICLEDYKIIKYSNEPLIDLQFDINDDSNNFIEDIQSDDEIKNILINEDAWEDSINDNKFYINNKIARIFPIIKNFNNYSKLKIDEDSFSYITVREIADMITKIISYHLLFFNLNPQKMVIIDYTAGVGGNVLSFSKYFSYVYGIEIDELRASYLENNINVYGFHNISVINDSSINFNYNDMIKINPNVIFMDPPWGGNDYKNSDKLILKLGEKMIEELVVDIIKIFSEYYLNNDPKNLNKRNKLIVLKLPKNYDIEYFYNYINALKVENYDTNIYLYILNKMIIIICELNYLNKNDII